MKIRTKIISTCLLLLLSITSQAATLDDAKAEPVTSRDLWALQGSLNGFIIQQFTRSYSTFPPLTTYTIKTKTAPVSSLNLTVTRRFGPWRAGLEFMSGITPSVYYDFLSINPEHYPYLGIGLGATVFDRNTTATINGFTSEHHDYKTYLGVKAQGGGRKHFADRWVFDYGVSYKNHPKCEDKYCKHLITFNLGLEYIFGIDKA